MLQFIMLDVIRYHDVPSLELVQLGKKYRFEKSNKNYIILYHTILHLLSYIF